MRNRIFWLAAVGLVCMGLEGCPELGGTNTFTLYNQLDRGRKIGELALTNVSTVVETKAGVNILPAPLVSGESFTVRNLPDGEYEITVRFQAEPSNPVDHTSDRRNQVMEGGRSYDWYFVRSNQTTYDEGIMISGPSLNLWGIVQKVGQFVFGTAN